MLEQYRLKKPAHQASASALLPRLAKGINPALLVSTLVTASAIALSATDANAISFVADRSSLNATDQIDWSTLGPAFSPFGPPDPAVFLPETFTATSQAGKSVQVDILTCRYTRHFAALCVSNDARTRHCHQL